MRLHVHVLRAENLLTTMDGEILHCVHMLTATVVSLSRVPFGVLIGHDGALSGQDGGTGEILRGNQKQPVTLPFFLGDNRSIDIRICSLSASKEPTASFMAARSFVSRMLKRSSS